MNNARAFMGRGILLGGVAAAAMLTGMVDQAFAQELAAWAAQAGGGVTQHVHAGRDAYVAGRDQTITNYRRPGELDRLCSRPRTVTPGQASAPIPVMIASPSPTRLPRAWSRRRFSSPTSS